MKNYKDFLKNNIQINLPAEINILLEKKPGTLIVSLGLFCSDLAKERELPFDLWSIYLEKLSSKHLFQFVILGGPSDQPQAKQFIDNLPKYIQKNFFNACGQLSLKQSIKTLESSDFFIGIDSALIHLSRFLEVPHVGFWGPTKPSAILHPTMAPSLHFYKKLSCSPCVHVTDYPPCLGQNICMTKHKQDIEEISEKSWLLLSSILNNNFSKNSPLDKDLNKSVFHQNSWAYMPDGSTQFLELTIHFKDKNDVLKN